MTQAEAQATAVVAPVATETLHVSRTHKSGTRRRLERLLADAAVRVALLVFVVWTLAPVTWMIISSLLNQIALTSVPPDLSPGQLTLDNYWGVLATGGVWSRP
jgi:ABC-type glycerol-3-phosphate transport system permease component